jgi:parallel beta-helix repeat protein
MKQKPAAFMSYVHADDKYGHLTTLRERLSDEVQVQTGREFPIFQDRKNIQWGQNWKQRLEDSLDEVTFLIAIITPGFFNSKYCRDELQRFLERERQLNRRDLILPVYFVDCPLLNDEAQRAQDELAQAIASRQYADWRELRFEPFTNPQVGKTLAQLAVQIRDALPLVQAVEKIAIPTSAPKEAQSASQSQSESSEQRAQQPSAKSEPPTRIVDPLHRGDHTTITEAIEQAKPGDRIIVRPGLYQEGLVIDKPLEIVGDGELGDVVVQATGKNVILFKTTMGRVTNLTLQQMGDGQWYAVDIAQGRLELEGCDITSQSLACVAIHNGADPRLRRNRIHDGKQSGVVVHENGQGTLEDNDIFGNASGGVVIKTGGNPTLRRNRIHDSKQGGVFVYENGQGTLEDNDIFGNALSGIEIKTGSNPTVRHNRIHDGKGGGVMVHGNSQGILEDNDIFSNANAGVEIKIGGNPTVRRNRIHDGAQSGVFVYENGQGILEDNDIFGNATFGVLIKEGGNPTLRRNRINKNSYYAIWVQDGGGGTIEDNDLRDNNAGALNITADSEENVTRSGNVEE